MTDAIHELLLWVLMRLMQILTESALDVFTVTFATKELVIFNHDHAA
jgi:hypothetical protein